MVTGRLPRYANLVDAWGEVAVFGAGREACWGDTCGTRVKELSQEGQIEREPGEDGW